MTKGASTSIDAPFSSSVSRFRQQLFQQILDFQIPGPAAQVIYIEFTGESPANAQTIAPLSFGALSSRPIPFQFSQ